MHTVLTPTRKSNRDSCWQFGYQALTGLGWVKNHVKVMGERKILNKSYKFSLKSTKTSNCGISVTNAAAVLLDTLEQCAMQSQTV